MQLPFAVIPLIHFTSDRRRMGTFANRVWVQVLAWITAAIIVVLNVRLVVSAFGDWLAMAGDRRWLIWLGLAPLGAALLLLLGWVTLEPMLEGWIRRFGSAPLTLPQTVGAGLETPVYRRILVPLDHTDLDRQAIGNAVAMARQHHADCTCCTSRKASPARSMERLSSTAEVEAGQKYLDEIVRSLQAKASRWKPKSSTPPIPRTRSSATPSGFSRTC